MRVWSCALLVLLGAALSAGAQETRGNISGTVKDAQGVVPRATVRITGVDTGSTQALITNDSGYFEAPLLQPGNYSITVEMAGYKTTDPGRDRARRGPAGERGDPPRGRPGQRAGDRHCRNAVAGHHRGVVRAELRQPDGRGAADVLEHADHADPLRAGVNPSTNQSLVSQGFADGTTRPRAARSAGSAATTTRSTAPPTAAAAAASRRRRTPT